SITIPGPPPYASSSVERCLSEAKSRRSHTRASSSPCFTPRAMIPSASSGANMSGKMVTKSNLIETFRQIDDDTLPRQVDVSTDLRGEGDIEAPPGVLHVQQHAAPSLFGIHHLAALAPFRVDEREPDQIVQEVLVLFELARLVLLDLDGPVAQVRNSLGRADLGELHQRAAGVRARTLDGRLARRRLVGGDERHARQLVEAIERIGPRLDARFAADAVRLADHSDCDAVCHPQPSARPVWPSGAPPNPPPSL